ncbi:transmembrane 7 superfamily member 3-like [Anopheles aquasalis]|uniref:transmembrane 7 superfamily member 3-like n=1 Tax=Anopheles aquasalis TaxID=42839 RepID=UPI00215AEDF2|nr:transmembrane 7 superfamily member 3-like [Anopheles aquasalis]
MGGLKLRINLCFLCLYILNRGYCLNQSEVQPHNDQTKQNLTLLRDPIYLNVPKNLKMNDINDYNEVVLPVYSRTTIRLANFSLNDHPTMGYALVQLNAFEYNVTLSYNSTIIEGGHLTGQNLGLLMYEDGDLYAFNLNPYQPVWVSIVLMIYNSSAPVPGGCNLEFPVETSPVLNVTLTPATIIVDTPPASVALQFRNNSSNACGNARLKYESYYIQMASHDFSQRSYFNALRSLMGYATAKTAGHQNTLSSPLHVNRHEYGRQPGRGMVFVTVVTDSVHRGFSLYVPGHTYSCRPFDDQSECYGLNIPWRMVALLLTLLAALEVVMGWLPVTIKCPTMLGYLMLLLCIEGLQHLGTVLPTTAVTAVLITAALVGAAIGLLLGAFAPQAAKILCAFAAGYLIVITQLGFINGNIFTISHVSIYMWIVALIIGLILSLTLPILLVTRSVIFGAICIFYGVNMVFGARLDYPLKHSFLRLFVSNYGSVYVDPMLDEVDGAALAAFIIILIVCLFLRSRYQPEVVQSDFQTAWSSRHAFNDALHTSTVISADDIFSYQQFANTSYPPVITRWTSGDDDVFESPRSNFRFFQRLRR